MKNFITIFIATTLFSFATVSCKKSDPVAPAKIAPTNLQVNAVVATDGSGSVAFTATATDAVTYDYDFGNSQKQTVPLGAVTYIYTVAGTNTFTVTVTATSSAGLTLKKSITVTVTVKGPDATLFWSDEFNTDGAPDPTKWSYETGAGGWGNNELEYYTDRRENSVVSGGTLKINAIKEDYNGSPYTSARLVSKGKLDFTYGKVEIRAKLAAGVGTWPALWMLGSNYATAAWPSCGEIDIMEHVGKNLNTIYGTLHYPGRSGANGDGGTQVISNATTEFHIYSLDWSADSVKISVDDQLYHVVLNSAALPFNHDFFFILNVAMGGGFGGDVDPAFTSATMEVDYIRVYK